MFDSCITTTDQGNIAEACAIALFTRTGYRVSKPLFVNCPYDLIIDDGNRLSRVQVKSTQQRDKLDRHYVVNIKTSGCNARSHTTKAFNNGDVDILYVLADDYTQWVIPTTKIEAKYAITLNTAFDIFKQ